SCYTYGSSLDKTTTAGIYSSTCIHDAFSSWNLCLPTMMTLLYSLGFINFIKNRKGGSLRGRSHLRRIFIHLEPSLPGLCRFPSLGIGYRSAQGLFDLFFITPISTERNQL